MIKYLGLRIETSIATFDKESLKKSENEKKD
jgi:hypothetical protein